MRIRCVLFTYMLNKYQVDHPT